MPTGLSHWKNWGGCIVSSARRTWSSFHLAIAAVTPIFRRMDAPVSRLRFIPFEVPTAVSEPPEGDDWIHEVKFDGYRTQLVIDKGKVTAFSRRGLDWSDRYPGVIAAAKDLPVNSAIFDGEAIGFEG